MAAGDIKEVGTTVGDVRDKVDLNVRAMAARLGPLGFPLVALWQGIQGKFKTGREETIAEVVTNEFRLKRSDRRIDGDGRHNCRAGDCCGL